MKPTSERKKPGPAKGTPNPKIKGRTAGTITRKNSLTKAMAIMLDEYARMEAEGRGEKEIAAHFGKSPEQLVYLRRVHSFYFRERYELAMAKVAEEIRAMAGTDRILAAADTYLTAAENADKWHQQQHGKPLFVAPTPAKIAAGDAEHTVASFFEQYYLPVCLAEAASETIRLYRLVVRRWVLLTGDPPMSQVTSLTFAKWRDAMAVMKGKQYRRCVTSNTIRMHLRHLQAMFDKAGPPDRRNRNAAGIIAAAPYIKPPRPEYPEPKITTEELVSRCYDGAVAMDWPKIEGCKPPAWWRALLVLVWNTGIRARTVFSLRMEHIDWKGKRLILPAEILKARKRLVLPLADTVVEHLQAIRSPRELVFEWPHSVEWFRRCFHKLQKESGIPRLKRFGLHTLRRTLGTRLFKENPAAAQLMLGHSALEITKRHYVNSEDVLESLRTVAQPAAFTGGQSDA